MAKLEAPKFVFQPPRGYLFGVPSEETPAEQRVPADGVILDSPGTSLATVQPRPVSRLWSHGQVAPKQFPESVLFVVAGGNAPGQNAFLKSVMQPLIDSGVKVMVAWGGIQTLLEETPDIVEITQKHLDQVDSFSGSVFIGTSRAPKTKQDPALIDQMAAAIKETGAEKVIVMGGDGTLKLAEKLLERGISLIGVPKTMDGNLAIKLGEHLERVYSLGFLSAVEKAAKYGRLLDAWGKQNKEIVVIEINGRDTGWITYETARKTGLPCFILEQKVSFADLFNKVKEMRATGGVLLVSESLEIIDKNGKVLDLQNLVGAPVPKDSSDTIKQYLAEHGENIRSINLTPLVKASLSADVRVVPQYLKEMADSAASQGRINVVSLDPQYMAQLGILTPNIYVVTNEPTLEALKAKLDARSKKTDVIIVANDHHFSDANQYWESPQADEAGRIHYTSRNLSGYLSAWMNTLQVKASHFVATHLLMASETDRADAVQADLMAQAVLQGLMDGVDGKIVSFVEDFPTALLLPLDELQNYQIPIEVTQADNHKSYVFRLGSLLYSLVDTPRAIFNFELKDPGQMSLAQDMNNLLETIHSLPRRGDFIAFARDLIFAKLGNFLQILCNHVYDEQKRIVGELKLVNAANGKIENDEFRDSFEPLITTVERIHGWWTGVKQVLSDFMDLSQAQSIAGKYHDFRNRINSLVGFYSLTADSSFDDVGTYIAVGALDPPANIRQLISDLARDPKNMARGAKIYERQVPSSLTVPDVAPAILEELKSVLMEFVNNGVKYAKEGQEPSVFVQITHDDQFLKLVVEDNGIGMSPEFIEKRYGRVGEREKRIADPAGFLNEGWGVADAIRRVEALGGTVKAESVINEGSTITVEIPLEALNPDDSIIASTDNEILPLDTPLLEETRQALEQEAQKLARVPVVPSPYLSSPVSMGGLSRIPLFH
ncbi:MAG: hypothetical protein ACD_73C00147G0002 [uncultured bacterium]|nr:MAG: hypothetical protein ACD_73C00147G0002 [uncultured bacterium]